MVNSRVRVLLADDDEDDYVIVRDLLREAGTERFELTWVSTYEQGIEAILASGFDVCLVDYRLGPRSGLELLVEVTARSSHPQVILLTGEGDWQVDANAATAGAADYLVKAELTAVLLERSIRYAVERGRTLQALRDARELAQASNLAKSAFLAAMSHEIRTPMNAILGMAEMLWESPLNPEQMQYVEVFRRAGSGLLLLINDILDLSKIEAGQLELERSEFDLEEVVDQAIELTAVKAQAKGIALLSHLSPGVATSLIGDPTRLRQILINLLGNAVKFTDSGEVVLTVGNHESGRSGELEFSVSDTGIGIPSDKLETIFGDFTQVDASTTRKYGGTGLGLGICRRLVGAMGGSLTATSSAGQGSTFRFTAQLDRAPGSARKVLGAPAGLHGQRVLLIDNNATNCLILKETLQAWGLETDTFRLPAEALACLPLAMTSERPYSLAILDRSLPGMDGFDAAAVIRRIAGALPILMLTSDTRPGDTTRRAEAGLSGYAVKPVSRTHLLRLVGDAMGTGKAAGLPPVKSADRDAAGTVEPARILVAEDSRDNRLLVQAYVKGSPYRLTFEENGKAALDRFATSDFDLILMDVQMPVMDGLAATRAIRALERERGLPSIPIVALTASASLRDIERSANAGCNAQLSKPVTKLELLSAIERYRQRPEPLETAPSLEPVRIVIPPSLAEIVPRYLEKSRQAVREMTDLLSVSDFERLAALGHQFKSSGRGYGFSELTRLGAALETSAQQTDRLQLRKHLAELEIYLNRVELVAGT